MNRRQWLGLLAALPVAAAAVPFLEPMKHGTARRPRPVGGPHARYFTDVALLTHDERRVRLHADLLEGKTVVVHFVDTACADAACEQAMRNLVDFQRRLRDRCGRDVFPYSLTLAPLQDTPARLRAYRDAHGVAPGWTFLTGSTRALACCRERFGFAEPGPAGGGGGRHTGLVLLGNEPHERWLAVPALASPEFLLTQVNRVAGLQV